MRYIGSKDKVIPFIESVILDTFGDVSNAVIADLFAGTVAVAKHFKKIGAKLITNDYLAFSYAFQVAFIKCNFEPEFKGLKNIVEQNNYLSILSFLNNLYHYRGFFYKEYTSEGSQHGLYERNYFSESNAIKIDSIRMVLSDWLYNNLISDIEFYILLTSLIEAVTKVSNISGTYGAFLKFDEKRKNKELILEPIEIINSNKQHVCYCKDIFDLIDIVSGDILYLDPPYNQRQYPPNYHILETVTLYDNPKIYGKTGRRPYKDKLSPFCVKNRAADALELIIKKAKFKHIYLSYNTEGILSPHEIYAILSKIGNVELFEQFHRRYKSNGNGNKKNGKLKELIFYVRK